MQATNVTGSEGTLNRQAKSAARSAFESAKQRFFNHLITAMKTPSLIRARSRTIDFDKQIDPAPAEPGRNHLSNDRFEALKLHRETHMNVQIPVSGLSATGEKIQEPDFAAQARARRQKRRSRDI